MLWNYSWNFQNTSRKVIRKIIFEKVSLDLTRPVVEEHASKGFRGVQKNIQYAISSIVEDPAQNQTISAPDLKKKGRLPNVQDRWTKNPTKCENFSVQFVWFPNQVKYVSIVSKFIFLLLSLFWLYNIHKNTYYTLKYKWQNQ